MDDAKDIEGRVESKNGGGISRWKDGEVEQAGGIGWESGLDGIVEQGEVIWVG